jgi:hypothetical protein
MSVTHFHEEYECVPTVRDVALRMLKSHDKNRKDEGNWIAMGVWKMDVATVYPLGAEISLAYRKLRDPSTAPANLYLQLRRPQFGHSAVSSSLPDLEERDEPHRIWGISFEVKLPSAGSFIVDGLSFSCRCCSLHVSAYMAIFRCVWCFTFYSLLYSLLLLPLLHVVDGNLTSKLIEQYTAAGC